MHKDNHWVLFESCAYMGGKGVLWGVVDSIYNPEARTPTCYAVHVDPTPTPWSDIVDNNVHMLQTNFWDYVIIGPRAPEDAEQHATKLLKPGGHLILWNRKDYNRQNTKKHLQIKTTLHKLEINKITQKPRVYSSSAPSKTACIARYGALGDYIMITPLIKALRDDGYKVTLNGTPYSIDLAKGNPYISNTIIQERNIIPNPLLGDYWKYWTPRYDKYVNLSESIEGKLLKLEGRREFYTPVTWRSSVCQDNYYDYTLKLGGYENITGQNGELYFNKTEEREAKEILAPYKDNFIIGWGLRGSSYHKNYPLAELVCKEFLDKHPDTIVLLLGDNASIDREFDLDRVVRLSGKLNPRQSACLIKHLDCIVSPESFIANVAGCYEVPKIILLSHSGPQNLTKYWKNCTTLTPDPTVAPCYGSDGCHQLHYNLDSCPVLELYDGATGESFTKTPSCTIAVSPERMLQSLEQVYNTYHK